MSEQLLHIDGSMGEGGGQVLRSALALSAGLGRPFSISGIRASRPKPGLMAGHVRAVKALAAVCGAQYSGAEVGSMQLSFEPGPVKAGEYLFDTQSAGSCTLLLQAVLPPLLFASGPSRLIVRGATHAYKTPSFDFFAETLLPALEKIGPRLTARLERHGFTAGGGTMTVDITPALEPRPLELPLADESRLPAAAWEFSILAANLPEGLAAYEAEQIAETHWGPFFPGNPQGLQEHIRNNFSVHIAQITDADGPGNVVLCKNVTPTGTRVLSAYGGSRRESACKAAKEICARLAYYREYWGSADRYLTDQLIVPSTLGRGGFFFCQKPTLHAQTVFEVVELFTGKAVTAAQLEGRPYWKIAPAGRG